MLSVLLAALLLATPPPPDDWRTPFEKGNGNTTATYAECLAYYQRLDAAYPEILVREAGPTDSGEPLHEVVVALDGNFEPPAAAGRTRPVVLIQNGIHPGEPEGIDASMMLARDLMTKKEMKKLLKHLVICIIPVYNVDGCINRNSSSRANQNGPESYGFRGNYRNLDLNRDFIKCDSKNARGFTRI
ncbi:MAG: hypothetical protein H7Z21_05900, partial [Hymenobacter sp.]|nr:hypothetical protein [Hymenobacter sp.]